MTPTLRISNVGSGLHRSASPANEAASAKVARNFRPQSWKRT